jgi:hypothetical protein
VFKIKVGCARKSKYFIAAQVPLLCVDSSVLELREVGNVTDVREDGLGVSEDDLVIDVDEDEVIGAGVCAGMQLSRFSDLSLTWRLQDRP